MSETFSLTRNANWREEEWTVGIHHAEFSVAVKCLGANALIDSQSYFWKLSSGALTTTEFLRGCADWRPISITPSV